MDKRVLLLPFELVKFWYVDAPLEMAGFFVSFNNYFNQLFALSLSIKTFASPLKNEYREGLIGFSRLMGVLVKSAIILTDLLLLIFILLLEIAVIVSFLAFPVITVYLLFL